jgi:hypothetical protein
MYTSKRESSGKKKGGKKKQPDKCTPKRYTLTKYVEDSTWKPLSCDELKEFMKDNEEIAKYLQNPLEIQNMLIPEVNANTPIYDHWEKAAKRIINHLWKQNGAWIFHSPVDVVAFNIPDYYDIVKYPIDFGSIKRKLNTNAYLSSQEFVHDVQCVFSNCIHYNGVLFWIL